MNAVLSNDVWIESAVDVSHDFHPRYDAVARTYVYRLGTASDANSPFHRHACWAIEEPVDLGALERAAAHIGGTHSFRSFAKSGQEHRGDICHVQSASWSRWGELGLEFTITANRFLHRMVRYLVGTMVTIGRGRRDEQDFPGLLQGPESGLTTSPPAPPQGLFLARVDYPAATASPTSLAEQPMTVTHQTQDPNSP
jgi:tRNA pseudouridine38-40 synthase